MRCGITSSEKSDSIMKQLERVAIIGSGPSGLAAIKSCLEEGLKPQAFERTDKLGGVWVYRESGDQRYPEAASSYDSLKINTSRTFFGFTDFPCPDDWTAFVSHQKCLAYMQDYAKTFDLERYIKFNSEVTHLSPSDDYETTGQWKLRYRSSSGVQEDVFDAVMICSGQYTHANLPMYPGQEIYRGNACTGSAYRNNKEYADKTVLVVGGGVSGGDIAIDISNVSKQTYMSSRHGFDMYALLATNGWPSDVSYGCRYQQYLPPSLISWLRKRRDGNRFPLHEMGFRDCSSDGKLPTSVIANDNFVNQALCGRILPKPAVKGFSEHGVSFIDDSSISDLDAVVFCTGYKMEFPYLTDNSPIFSKAGLDLYKLIFPATLKHKTLACIGFFKNVSSGSPVSVQDMQTRWTVQVWKGNCLLPPKEEMIEAVARRRKEEHALYGRDVLMIQAIGYNDALARDMGCYPSLVSLLISDPRLALHMLFSPVVPATYRLVGPHSWEGARDVILNSWNTAFLGTCSLVLNKERSTLPLCTPKIYIVLLTLMILFLSYGLAQG
ncbi:putative dimethylaniline monooxygenase [Apostichopus japonicus]|uniref:Flavin-containing monooxygenase n=2 Tax=Stichopus japonicus TaxID=307972 RepID=A0A2G8JSW9_STIJA|nr:putative dimethylaniline monooxygenase [Apostichopus japonicus]